MSRQVSWLVKPTDDDKVFFVNARSAREASEKAREKLDAWTPEPRRCGFDVIPAERRGR